MISFRRIQENLMAEKNRHVQSLNERRKVGGTLTCSANIYFTLLLPRPTTSFAVSMRRFLFSLVASISSSRKLGWAVIRAFKKKCGCVFRWSGRRWVSKEIQSLVYLSVRLSAQSPPSNGFIFTFGSKKTISVFWRVQVPQMWKVSRSNILSGWGLSMREGNISVFQN